MSEPALFINRATARAVAVCMVAHRRLDAFTVSTAPSYERGELKGYHVRYRKEGEEFQHTLKEDQLDEARGIYALQGERMH